MRLSLCAFLALLSLSYAIPVYVMLPLDTVTSQRTLNNPSLLQQRLQTLKNNAHIDGFMCDVWWGLVERDGSQQYYWTPYQQLVTMARQIGLKTAFVMSFHQCGGNVGDNCNVTLPAWINTDDSDIFYKDREGFANKEYISLGADNLPLTDGRTPIKIYQDFMASFRDNVLANNTDVVSEVQVGMGPAGELRYPSYPLDRWSFCGVGEFQCYDSYMLASLKQAAAAAGHPEWGNGGPSNAGTYNSQPYQTAFFSDSGFDNYASAYGRFFLNWYFNSLLDHSSLVMGAASTVFKGYNIRLTGKIAGIHWWVKSNHHAAEVTAGYINVNGFDPYLAIAKNFAKYGFSFDFTCLEMLDSEQPSQCNCSPQQLVYQTHNAANTAGIGYAGENALARYDQTAYNTILNAAGAQGKIHSFYYLRLDDTLMQSNNLNTFANFANAMHSK
eukprot:TRINITY_DN1315_c0_g1_i1.p1 TRINITY_DN1315_c0_g1~~TRINITY_DN1315_c0_g1_i1.p1  ORF type:complete len:442 (-),score=177.01 TRINITY_DN1315_c0_g1_i1:380-1705(-)